MRVLLVNDYREGGGAEAVVAAGHAALREAGHEVELVAAAGSIGDAPAWRRGPLGYIDSRRGRPLVRRAIAAFRPDVVHTHNVYHLLSPGVLREAAAWRAAGGGRRLIVTAHDFHLICPNPGGRVFPAGEGRARGEPAPADRLGDAWWVLRRRWDVSAARSALRVLQHARHYVFRDVRRSVDAVCCPGPVLCGVLAGRGLPVVELPNPAPEPEAPRPRAWEGRLRLVFVGRLEPEKGVAEFLSMLGRAGAGTEGAPAVGLEVFGEGSARAACEAAAARLGAGVPVTFRGRVPREGVAEALRSAHALVLPSLLDETAPLVLDEAVACGASVLVADRGAMRAFVERTGVGRVFDGPASLAAALRAMSAEAAAGRLNAFDPAGVLRGRTAAAHAAALGRVYRGETAAARGRVVVA